MVRGQGDIAFLRISLFSPQNKGNRDEGLSSITTVQDFVDMAFKTFSDLIEDNEFKVLKVKRAE